MFARGLFRSVPKGRRPCEWSPYTFRNTNSITGFPFVCAKRILAKYEDIGSTVFFRTCAGMFHKESCLLSLERSLI